MARSAGLSWVEAEEQPRPWDPDPHKLAAVKHLVSHPLVALWVDPGFGKTSCVYAAFKVLKQKRLARRMLVIAPLRPCWLTWPKEQKKWTDFHGLKVIVLHGDHKDTAAFNDADIYVTNPESLEWLLHSRDRHFRRLGFDTLCVDESSGFKNMTSVRFRLLKPVLDTFARRWTLTGTPSSNGYMDVFGQIYITDLGASLGEYITAYRSEFFSPTGHMGMEWGLNDGAEQLIQKKLKNVVFRLPIHHSVKVPMIQTNPIFVELPPKVRGIYDQMEEFMVAEIGKLRVVTALSASAAMMKCAQIASGGVYLDPQSDDKGLRKLLKGVRDAAFLHDEKTDALEALHEELGGKPLLVAYDFKHDVTRLQKRFGKDMAILGGKGSGMAGMRHDKELEEKWNRGRIPLLFGHPRSIGHGLNLQESCNAVAWYSITWDLELWSQFNQRVARQGNPNEIVMVHHIVAKNTVDELKLDALVRKGEAQSRLLQALTSYLERRSTKCRVNSKT